MKRIIPIVLILLFFAACSSSPAAPHVTEPVTQPQEPTLSAQEPTISLSSSFPFSFSTEDLHGNQVTEYSLGEYDFFFVYYWATWCRACINSMPSLTQLAEEFGDRVGFISLLGDFDMSRNAAINITENANIPFITVNALIEELDGLMELLTSGFLPTSVIVDRNGNVIGEQIIGGSMERMQAAINYALQQ